MSWTGEYLCRARAIPQDQNFKRKFMIHAPQDNLLVIAPRIPRPNLHSGDLRLSTMLEIMTEEWRVFLIAAGTPGDEQYISRLEQHGVRVYRNPLSLREKLLQSETFQLALIEFYHT